MTCLQLQAACEGKISHIKQNRIFFLINSVKAIAAVRMRIGRIIQKGNSTTDCRFDMLIIKVCID